MAGIFLTFDGMKKAKGETISGGFRSMMLMVVLQFLVAGVWAQGFSNLYYDNRPTMVFGSIDARNDVFYVTGVTLTENPPYYRRALLAKISNSGILDSAYIFIDSNQYNYEIFLNSLKTCSDGNYYATGNMTDSVPRAFLIKLDTAGTVKAFAQYIDTQAILFHGQDVVEIPNYGFLIAIHMQLTNHNVQIMIIRTDTLGNEINRTIFGGGNQDTPWAIRPMLNGNYMVGAFTGKTTNTSPYWAKTWLIEVDSMGNMVKQWTDADNNTMWPQGIQQTADSGWIMTRYHVAYDVTNFQKLNASIVKLDKNFNKEWEHRMGDSSDATGFYDVEILPDGKFITCGSTPIWGGDSAYRYGWVVKFDTDGTILWDRKYVAYERYNATSFLYDIDVLPNGDLVACGELQFGADIGIRPFQQGWILRTDSNGCELSSCVTGISQSEIRNPKSEIVIFPNPASDQVFIEGANTTQGELTIADELGRVLYTNPHFDGANAIKVNNWMNGIYFYRLITTGHEQQSGKIVVQH